MNQTLSPAPGGAWRALFWIAGLYDVLLGAAFLVAGESILKSIGMALPPHIAYIHLSAIFIVVQGVSYLLVARDPWSGIGLAWIGVLYKASYVGLAAWYLLSNQMPSNFFIPWAIADAGFLVAFLLFIRAAGSRPQR